MSGLLNRLGCGLMYPLLLHGREGGDAQVRKALKT